MPEDERDEERETDAEPELEEQTDNTSQQEEEPEPERPSDYALGRDLTDINRRLDAQEAAHQELAASLQAAVSAIPEAVGSAVQSALEALTEDTHGERADEAPLDVNPALRWHEKLLLGRK
jgi:hypothetical protein